MGGVARILAQKIFYPITDMNLKSDYEYSYTIEAVAGTQDQKYTSTFTTEAHSN